MLAFRPAYRWMLGAGLAAAVLRSQPQRETGPCDLMEVPQGLKAARPTSALSGAKAPHYPASHPQTWSRTLLINWAARSPTPRRMHRGNPSRHRSCWFRTRSRWNPALCHR